MTAINPRLFALLLCASLVCAVPAHAKTILPDACGDDSVKLDVTTKKNQPAPAPPEAGKAQIVFSESGGLIARFGMDGSWVGANDRDSYFAVEVAPGEHHLCLSFQFPALALASEKTRKKVFVC
jgi:hypothetical protein